MSSFSISKILLFGFSLGLTSTSYAVEIPKPVINIPKPVINVPKPNIPRPTINVAKPNVTINVPKPNINIPGKHQINVPKLGTPNLIAVTPKAAYKEPVLGGTKSKQVTTTGSFGSVLSKSVGKDSSADKDSKGASAMQPADNTVKEGVTGSKPSTNIVDSTGATVTPPKNPAAASNLAPQKTARASNSALVPQSAGSSVSGSINSMGQCSPAPCQLGHWYTGSSGVPVCYGDCGGPFAGTPVTPTTTAPGPTLSAAPPQSSSPSPNYDIIKPDSSISKTAGAISVIAGGAGLIFPPAAPVLEPLAWGAAAVSVGTAPDVFSGATGVADKVLDPFPAGNVMEMLKPDESDPPASLDLNSHPELDLNRGPPPPPYRSWAAYDKSNPK